MAQKPSQILSSSSEHLRRSYLERGMGGRKAIAGGELCVFRHQKVGIKALKIKLNLKFMRKIEYRVEGIDAKDFNDEKTIKEIKEFLLQLGSEGWEFIEIVPTSQFEEPRFTGKQLIMKKGLLIFKKEIE